VGSGRKAGDRIGQGNRYWKLPEIGSGAVTCWPAVSPNRAIGVPQRPSIRSRAIPAFGSEDGDGDRVSGCTFV